MDNKLREILENKHKEIKAKKQKRDFCGSMVKPKVGDISIIAEIKLRSPSMGKLGEEKEIISRVKSYEKYHADAISIVVDQEYFGGKLEYIKLVKAVVSLPILAKDFIMDPFQIYELKLYGADAVLLIVKIVSSDQLVKFVKLANKLNIEPVVEVQNAQELKDALKTDTRIIVVNARDLSTFKVNVDRACKLIKSIPKEFVSLGFSGVLGRNEVEQYKNAGAKGVLVGTSLMKSKDAEKSIKDLKGL